MPQGDERCLHLNVEAVVGACSQLFQAHAFELAIDRLDAFAIQAQVILISPVMALHVLLADGDQTYSAIVEQEAFAGCIVVTLVAVQGGVLGQVHRQFVNRRQIMIGPWQKLEGDGLTLWCADQVQALAEELLFLAAQ